MADYAYDAFISYSHKDMEHASWLQKKLESYRIPKDLGAAETLGTDENLKVFRDQTDLAGAELQESLQKELTASKYLIVVCSPASAASPWVNEEVLFFQSLGRGNRILSFIVEGEPESKDPEKECYPPAMRASVEHHMLGANIQEIGKNGAFLKILSILLDVRFNRLADRDRKRRRKRILVTAVTVCAVAAVVTGLLVRNAMIVRKNQEMAYLDFFMNAIDSNVNFDTGEGMQTLDVGPLRDSANAGNSKAMLYLGYCYRNGWSVEQNPEEAFSWFRKGAEAGHDVCMMELGSCYQNGMGTEINPEEAFRWFKQAAEAGNVHAMVMLGLDYEAGIGTEQDPEQAYYWYKTAADAGFDQGMEQMARCCRDGIGCEPDREEAFSWIVKLAETGNTVAMYNAGLMTQYGFGTEEDPAAAYQWYRKAAEAGDGDAAMLVGWCTENNYGTENAALEWYKQAVEQGCEEAQAEVDRLNQELHPESGQ